MQSPLVLRLAGLALLVTWVAMVFSVSTSEFRSNERTPMTAWQTIVKLAKIMVYDEGRFLRPDPPLNATTIVVPRDRQSGEFVDVTPPERAGAFLFVVGLVAGLVLMLIGAVVGRLPRPLMLGILGTIGFFAGMYYLNQRPLIPFYMKMPDAAVYVIMFKSIWAMTLAFASGLFLSLRFRPAPHPTPA